MREVPANAALTRATASALESRARYDRMPFERLFEGNGHGDSYSLTGSNPDLDTMVAVRNRTEP